MFGQRMLRFSFFVLVAAVALKAEEDYPAQEISFEAEDAIGFTPDRVHWRSNANPSERAQAVWLVNDGELLKFPICLPTATDVQVTSVRFSSDGWMKEAAMLVDNKEVGGFNTTDNSDHGNNWNSFNITYGPFESAFLDKGMHFIDVLLKKSMDSDPWGIEIDQITLRFGVPFTRKELACPSESPAGTIINPSGRLIRTETRADTPAVTPKTEYDSTSSGTTSDGFTSELKTSSTDQSENRKSESSSPFLTACQGENCPKQTTVDLEPPSSTTEKYNNAFESSFPVITAQCDEGKDCDSSLSTSIPSHKNSNSSSVANVSSKSFNTTGDKSPSHSVYALPANLSEIISNNTPPTPEEFPYSKTNSPPLSGISTEHSSKSRKSSVTSFDPQKSVSHESTNLPTSSTVTSRSFHTTDSTAQISSEAYTSTPSPETSSRKTTLDCTERATTGVDGLESGSGCEDNKIGSNPSEEVTTSGEVIEEEDKRTTTPAVGSTDVNAMSGISISENFVKTTTLQGYKTTEGYSYSMSGETTKHSSISSHLYGGEGESYTTDSSKSDHPSTNRSSVSDDFFISADDSTRTPTIQTDSHTDEEGGNAENESTQGYAYIETHTTVAYTTAEPFQENTTTSVNTATTSQTSGHPDPWLNGFITTDTPGSGQASVTPESSVSVVNNSSDFVESATTTLPQTEHPPESDSSTTAEKETSPNSNTSTSEKNTKEKYSEGVTSPVPFKSSSGDDIGLPTTSEDITASTPLSDQTSDHLKEKTKLPLFTREQNTSQTVDGEKISVSTPTVKTKTLENGSVVPEHTTSQKVDGESISVSTSDDTNKMSDNRQTSATEQTIRDKTDIPRYDQEETSPEIAITAFTGKSSSISTGVEDTTKSGIHGKTTPPTQPLSSLVICTGGECSTPGTDASTVIVPSIDQTQPDKERDIDIKSTLTSLLTHDCKGQECLTKSKTRIHTTDSVTTTPYPDQHSTEHKSTASITTKICVDGLCQEYRPCSGESCPIVVTETACSGENCPTVVTETHCSGENCPTVVTETPCLGRNCPTVVTETPCFGENCPTFNTEKPCFGENCPTVVSKKLCFGENCPTVVTETPCSGENCHIVVTETPCFGENCHTVVTETPCSGENCPTVVTEPTCSGENCPTVVTETPCSGENCPTVVTETPCFGENCSIVVTETPCFGENCSTFVTETLCSGENCPIVVTETPPCSGENCPVVLAEKPCSGENCPTAVPEKPCSGENCPTVVTETLCLGEICSTVLTETSCSGEKCPTVVTETPCFGEHCQIVVTETPCVGKMCPTVVTETPCSGENCPSAVDVPRCIGKSCSSDATHCSGPDCLIDNTGTLCSGEDCSSGETAAPCLGETCLVKETVKPCSTENCPTDIPVTPCFGENCSEKKTSIPCFGDDCQAEEMEKPCSGEDCKTDLPLFPCFGENCSEKEISTGCFGGDCPTAETVTPCFGDDCPIVETGSPCFGDDCPIVETVSPCSGDDCPTVETTSPCSGDDCSIVETVSSCFGDDCPTVETTSPCSGDDCSIVETVSPCFGDDCPTVETTSPCSGDDCSTVETVSPCFGDDCPIVETVSPCSGNDCPTVETTSPCFGDDCPTVETVSPCFGDDCHTVETVSPCIGDDCPTIETVSPCSGYDCPTVETVTPCFGDDCPTVETTSPCSGNDCPTVGAVSPCSGDDCPTMETVTPCFGDDCPTVETVSPCFGDDCPTVETVSPCSGDDCPTMETVTPCSGDDCPTVETVSPCSGDDCPTVETVTPCSGDDCPTVETVSPCSGDDCPVVETVSPCSGDDCPTMETITPCFGDDCPTVETVSPCSGDDCPTVESITPCFGDDCPTVETISPCSGDDCPTKETITPCFGDDCPTVETVSPCSGDDCSVVKTVTPCSGDDCPIFAPCFGDHCPSEETEINILKVTGNVDTTSVPPKHSMDDRVTGFGTKSTVFTRKSQVEFITETTSKNPTEGERSTAKQLAFTSPTTDNITPAPGVYAGPHSGSVPATSTNGGNQTNFTRPVERFTFSCPAPGQITVVKNSYYSCYKGNYRFDLYGSEVTSFFFHVAFPIQYRRGKRSVVDEMTHDVSKPRATQMNLLAVGNTDPAAIPHICSRAKEMTTLSDASSFLDISKLNKTLPAMLDPRSFPSFLLRFNLTGSASAVKGLKQPSFVFALMTSCCQSELEADVEVVNLANRETIIKSTKHVTYADRNSPGRLIVTIPVSVSSMEIRLNFSRNSQSFALNALALALTYVKTQEESELNTGKVYPTSSYWIQAGHKRKMLSHENGYAVEAVNQPGVKTMKIKTQSQDGKRKELSASRLILSDLSSGAFRPRVVFDQTSRCYFFTESDPSKQTSFVLGPRNMEREFMDSDLDEIHVVNEGNGRFAMVLNSLQYGTRSLVFAVSSTMTTVIINEFTQGSGLPSSPLCSVLLPCTEYNLDAEAFIRADNNKDVRSTDAWRTLTGNAISFMRPTCGPICG